MWLYPRISALSCLFDTELVHSLILLSYILVAHFLPNPSFSFPVLSVIMARIINIKRAKPRENERVEKKVHKLSTKEGRVGDVYILKTTNHLLIISTFRDAVRIQLSTHDILQVPSKYPATSSLSLLSSLERRRRSLPRQDQSIMDLEMFRALPCSDGFAVIVDVVYPELTVEPDFAIPRVGPRYPPKCELNERRKSGK